MAARSEGVTAIGRLLFSLVGISGIALAAAYMVFSASPVATPSKVERVTRTLPYERAISDPSAAGEEADVTPEAEPKTPPLPAEAEAKPETPPVPTPKPKQAAKPPQMDLPPDDGEQPADTAAMPPDGQGEYSGGGAEPLPWQTDGHTAAMPNNGDLPDEYPAYDPQAEAQGYGQEPQGYSQEPYDPSGPYGQGQDAFDQAYADQNGGPPPGAYGQQPYGQPAPGQYGQPAPGQYGQEAYGQPAPGQHGQQPADPYSDPYARPPANTYGQPGAQAYGQPGAAGEEWVQVTVSGTGMRSTASEDAPMLFAFPYGRNLRVVSRHNDWVEVADPQSSATGWMKAEMLGPGVPPGQQAYQQNEAYYEQPVEERRRRPIGQGGFADMINRAFGGGR